MHMADTLISPAVGGTMLAAAVGTAAFSIKKVKDMDEKKVPLMGVMAAFVFSAQMINFTIPGTGSSGHLGGGLLLAVLLGPYAGYLSMAVILLIQALFFADGGLLAYGSNLINMGFFSCFIVYPFIYKFITKKGLSKSRIWIGSIAAGIIGLQFGSLGVVAETFLSGKTELPFIQFLWTMQGIHLAIGLVEGVVTAAVISFVLKVRPDIIGDRPQNSSVKLNYKPAIIGFLLAALLAGGLLSLYASSNPDGLEWSIGKVNGGKEITSNTKVHEIFEKAQEKTSVLPDYSFKKQNNGVKSDSVANKNVATSMSGLIGSAVTVAIIVLVGFTIKFVKRKRLKRQV